MPPPPLRPWLDGGWERPGELPTLRETLPDDPDDLGRLWDQLDSAESDGSDGSAEEPEPVRLADHPEIQAAYQDWAPRWQEWADREQADRPVRERYQQLFSAYQTLTGNPEAMELVVGLGYLCWHPDAHDPVDRHLLTVPATIRFDDRTGRLTVERVESPRAFIVELDMLDPGLTNKPGVTAIREEAADFLAHPLDRDEVGTLVKRLVHSLDADGAYDAGDARPRRGGHAAAAFAPAVILRRRSQRGLLELFHTIEEQLEADARVHPGLLPLVDPDFQPTVTGGHATDGAVVTIDDELFLPLPVNDKQRQILQRVDTCAQTLVQGPPGTGKTHTAAALLSHLLAQGKRVLVTAQTDRALKEVREKLPDPIKPLSVAVVGTSREDMSDLKVAVEHLGSAAHEYDRSRVETTISRLLQELDQSRRERARLYQTLRQAREAEAATHPHAGAERTLARIAEEHREQAGQFGWLAELVEVDADAAAPLTSAEIRRWRAHLLDDQLSADEPESRQRTVELAAVPEPAQFAALVAEERAAAEADQAHQERKVQPAYPAIRALEPEDRQALQQRLHLLADQADELAGRREAWMSEALADVLAGRAPIWRDRARRIADLASKAAPLVELLGHREVVATVDDLAPLVNLARALGDHLRAGGKLKLGPDGMPKIGAFSPKVVKAAAPLFDAVRVDGRVPTTGEELAAFIAWEEATRLLTAMDRAWPASVQIPQEDTTHEWLQWHRTEQVQLERLLRLAEQLDVETGNLKDRRIPPPDWTDLTSVRAFANLVDAATAEDRLMRARDPLVRLESLTGQVAMWDDAAPTARRLHEAVQERDPNGYATAHDRLQRLAEVCQTVARRDELAARLGSAAPGLREAVEETADAPEWSERLAEFDQAWQWAATGTWLRQRERLDVNAIQTELQQTEERIRQLTAELAATRAWSHAVSPERLSSRARTNLEQYARLVRRLGKGTGKYAAQRQAEIRQAMERCRDAVPVWIMPLYRIAEQFRIQPDMFDVVIVDEASQAGLEASFLLYLAPKIVVIGDDKQVSPAAVGVDQQQLRNLAAQYLADDPYRATWQDPQTSLFDLAKERFSGRLVLTEHRRCVPEIIEFSNQIAYEPDGVRLVPVRQYGADRLDPVKPVFVSDGYTRGTTYRINPPEADAIVAQIEKCLADPRYDGLTFGVISLLGKAQAAHIERKLLERIPPEEWRARDLRCGDSADFQGSERDVMFLSMVVAPEEGRRIGALTQEMYVQRYNVAASRAKDQMWVFHSVRPEDLGNPDDMRFRLLEYCYAVQQRQRTEVDGALLQRVPEDQRVPPFDSLFEQRVFNRLYDRGYTVVPQYEVANYRIDLVVVGAQARLAVECDGDAWHGPDRYQQDLARQRDLERCGWRFFRIRESEFYADQEEVLGQLWATLRELEITPPGMVDGEDTTGRDATDRSTIEEDTTDQDGDVRPETARDSGAAGSDLACPEPVPSSTVVPEARS